MAEAFSDRRERLFGRMADIRHLTDRAHQPGLTAVVARPLMGKTWTLTEVARLLEEEGRFLVGYHESKGSESSHLLYAVSDLYARWLSDSTMREQAISMWERHKDNLVPRIGQMVGVLFEKLAGKQMPVAGVVRAAFDGLAEAQKDLLSGGLQLAPLPYDQALSLTELVAKVSQRRIVLILDAWEKSPSLRSELVTLETFLKHREDWPDTHIVLAVRNPEFDSTKLDNEGYQRASDLCRINGAAQRYELAPIKQDDVKERDRLIRFVRNAIPVAEHEAEQRLLDMIDGYPGVLNFWTDDVNRTKIRTLDDLRKVARDAQALRYLELEHLLAGLLDEPSRTLAARLAFFPRLDRDTWAIFRDLLLKDQSEIVWNALVDAKVLMDERFPTYGHDTRHAAAQHWFIKNSRPLLRRVSGQLIEAIALQITGTNHADRLFAEALAGCSEMAYQIELDAEICCLTDAARAVVNDVEPLLRSEFDAIYPSVIRENDSVTPLIAMALIYRGSTKRERGDPDGAIDDYTTVASLANAPAEQVAGALINCAITKNRQGDPGGAVADYTVAIGVSNARAELVAVALVNRGTIKGKQGNLDGAIDDYAAVIALPNAPAEQVAGAFINLGTVKLGQGEHDRAIDDFTAAIAVPNAPAKEVAKALVNRAFIKQLQGDFDGQIDDYNAAIALPNAPAEPVSRALFCRGFAKGERHDPDGAIEDFNTLIGLPDAPAERIATALFNLGVMKAQRGDPDGAIADYTAVIERPDAPADVIEAARRTLAILTKSPPGLQQSC